MVAKDGFCGRLWRDGRGGASRRLLELSPTPTVLCHNRYGIIFAFLGVVIILFSFSPTAWHKRRDVKLTLKANKNKLGGKKVRAVCKGDYN